MRAPRLLQVQGEPGVSLSPRELAGWLGEQVGKLGDSRLRYAAASVLTQAYQQECKVSQPSGHRACPGQYPDLERITPAVGQDHPYRFKEGFTADLSMPRARLGKGSPGLTCSMFLISTARGSV
jgi:hypothetical protein